MDGAAVQPDDDGDVTWINWTAGTTEQSQMSTKALMAGLPIAGYSGTGYTLGTTGNLGSGRFIPI
jgi:hypothetical protein